MEEKQKYSQWEYDEVKEGEEQAEGDESQEDSTPDPNAEEEDTSNEKSPSVDDDTPVEIEIDGEKQTVTLGELRNGYMRQSDYTKKSQEVADLKKQFESKSNEEKKDVVDEAKKIEQNPQSYSQEDIDTAKTLLDIAKSAGLTKEFGLMTREDFEAEEAKKKQLSQFESKMNKAEDEVKKMKGMPKFDEDDVLDHMQATGIMDPLAAYKNKYDAKYREFIIKQAQGSKSYQSDKGGKKPQPKEKEVNVRTDEGHRSFLLDELHKIKS